MTDSSFRPRPFSRPPAAVSRRGALALGLAAAAGGLVAGRPGGAPGAAEALTLSASRAIGVVPFGVAFTAEGGGVGPGQFHEVDYVWEFGEPGATYRNHDPAAHYGPDANEARGPVVAHTFETPGTKTVRCRARTRDGAETVATIRIEARDPDAFDWGRDLAVSFRGDFAGAPAGARRVSSLTELRELAGTFKGIARVRFRAGETFDLSAGVCLSARFHRLSWWGRWGEGADPTLVFSDPDPVGRGTVIGFRDCGEVTISDLRFEGGYDPSTGIATRGRYLAVQTTAEMGPLTLHRIASRGMMMTYYPIQTTSETHISDCDIGDWGDYGALIGGQSHLAIHGGRIRQRAGIRTEDGKIGAVNPNKPDHGPLRLTANRLVHIGRISLRAVGGWSGPGHNQPCIRLLRNDETLPGGHRICFDRICAEGGYNVFTLGRQNRGQRVLQGGDGVIDGCVLTGDAQTTHVLRIAYGGWHVRNCVMTKPDLPHAGLGLPAFSHFVELESDPEDIAAAAAAPPIRLYGCTFVQAQGADRAPAALALARGAGPEHDLAVANNLVHAPHVPNAADFPDRTLLDPDDWRPLPGSAAIGAMTDGLRPIRDIEGRVRGARSALGAYDGPGR